MSRGSTQSLSVKMSPLTWRDKSSLQNFKNAKVNTFRGKNKWLVYIGDLAGQNPVYIGDFALTNARFTLAIWLDKSPDYIGDLAGQKPGLQWRFWLYKSPVYRRPIINGNSCTGLVVIGGESCPWGCGLKSQHRILDICCKNCNVCFKRRKNSPCYLGVYLQICYTNIMHVCV